MQLTCPVCNAPLTQREKNLRCEANHSFDAARQGYWNLLLAHKKRSKDPGDNPEMVQARRQFLDMCHYQQLSDEINRIALTNIEDTSSANILDMGCGEGYYTARLQQQLIAAGIEFQLTGLDISKHAVKAACSRTKDIQWLVASGANTPVPDSSLDLQLVLFSRLMPEALAKPLKESGTLLVAWPGDAHLIELRRLIYKEIRHSQFNPAQTLADFFQHVQTETVRYTFELHSPEEIATLLAMTPHGQRLKKEAQAQICEQQNLQLTLDVNLGTFKRL